MADVRCIFRHEGKMTGLPGRPLSGTVNRATQRFMVGEDCERAALQSRPEMFDREVQSKQLSIKRTLLLLSRGKLAREESQWSLVTALAEHSANGNIGGVGRQRQGGGRVRVDQHCGLGEGSLDSDKGRESRPVPIKWRLLGLHRRDKSM